jgi:hypothetical protein
MGPRPRLSDSTLELGEGFGARPMTRGFVALGIELEDHPLPVRGRRGAGFRRWAQRPRTHASRNPGPRTVFRGSLTSPCLMLRHPDLGASETSGR